MRILMATGIYPPEIGGPSYYAKNLADAFRKKEEDIEVVYFGRVKGWPTGLRHLGLFFKLIPGAIGADVILALDTFSVALPAALVALILRKMLVIRTGGDFLWEQYVDRTRDMVPLPFFYDKHQPFSTKEKIVFALTKWIMKRAFVVFSTEFQKRIWMPAYGIKEERTVVIPNAIAARFEPQLAEKKNFLAFGRAIGFKNVLKMQEAFILAKEKVPEITLEEGKLPQHLLMEKIQKGYCVLVPSLAEISPNLVLDALRAGKPFITSKYCEYTEMYKDFGLFVDPLDVRDIAEKIVMMCDEKVYEKFSKNIAKHPLTRTYDALAEDFLALFKRLA